MRLDVPIKILYVSPFSRIGGGEVSLLTIIRNLDKARFSPLLVCYENGPFVDRARGLGIETVVMKRAGPISELLIIERLTRLIKSNNVRLVHVNSLDIRAGVAARLAGVPCIGHLRVIFPYTWRDMLFVRLSRVTVAVSNAVVEAFCKKSDSLRKRFIVLPNVVEVPCNIKPALLKSEFGIPPEAVLVGMAGRPDPFKGHSDFIDAAVVISKNIGEARFVIIGEATAVTPAEREYIEGLKTKIARADLTTKFIFTGFREDILDVIAALDILVVPSIIMSKCGQNIAEGFGRVVIEAMAVGVPVVASDVGGIPEIIEQGVSGVVVPSNNPEAIASEVMALLLNKEHMSTIRRLARLRVERNYSPENLKELYSVYNNIADNNG